MRVGPPVLAVITALLLLGGGCKKENAYIPPPPPDVGVAHPIARKVAPTLDATGNLVAYNQIDLSARIEGFVQQITYKDGATVKAGQTLFVIEPAPYEAKLRQAQAQLASAQAQYVQASTEYERQASLGRSDFAARSAVDQAKATRDSDQANVANQQAAVALASINLGYTRVTAPFDGVATNHLVSVGDLVGVAGPTKLATVVQLDPIYATFNISDQEVQNFRTRLAQRGITFEMSSIPVAIGLMTEEGYPHPGKLDYISPVVDAATGTLTVRAILQNPRQDLLPGYFVRIHLTSPVLATEALLVPDTALGTDQAGRYLLIVNNEKIVEQRRVQTGQQVGALRVITAGLKPDDNVVVTGLQHAVPGSKVAPSPAPMPES